MDRSDGAKRSPSKPIGGTSSAAAAAPSKGRGRKPSRGENNGNDIDPKDRDPIVDKKFFDGTYNIVYCCDIYHYNV